MICVVAAGILIESTYKYNHIRSDVFLLKVWNVMPCHAKSILQLWVVSCILWWGKTPHDGISVKVHVPWHQARCCSCWPRWTLECLGREKPTISWEACFSQWLVGFHAFSWTMSNESLKVENNCCSKLMVPPGRKNCLKRAEFIHWNRPPTTYDDLDTFEAQCQNLKSKWLAVHMLKKSHGSKVQSLKPVFL